MRLVPVMVTLVPPAGTGPALEGLMPVTAGTADAAVGAPENWSRLALEADPSVKSRFPLPTLRSDVG